MKKTTREQIGNKKRFDIFKRDEFTRQYCGKTPPNAVLEVDHIIPVSKGGGNESDNLITSCFECNRGKRDHELTQIPETLEAKHLRMIEKESQYKEFKKFQDNIEKRLAKEIESINEIYSNHHDGYELTETFKNASVKSFIKKIDVFQVRDAMHKACAKGLNSHYTIKYFCGICWSIIKQEEEQNG